MIRGSRPGGGAVDRRSVSSGSPYEPVIGFSRAVAAGHHVAVAGTRVPRPPLARGDRGRRCRGL